MTTVERALLDAADSLTARRVERAFDEALALRLTSRTKVTELLDRAGEGRKGTKLLKALLDPRRPSSRTKSPPEEAILAVLRTIPTIEAPQCNVYVHGLECDFYFPRAATVVEFHSFRWHNNRFTWRKDTRKRQHLERAGIHVIYLLDEDLEPAELLATTAGLVETLTRRTIEQRIGSAA